MFAYRVTWRNFTDHGQSFAAPEAPGAADPPLLHSAQNRLHGPFLKTLLSTAAYPWSERLLTQPKLYVHVTLAGTLHFLVHALHSWQYFFLILLISLLYNTFLTILTYIHIWLAVFIATFKFTHSSNDFQFLRVQWITCFRILKKKKNP